MSASSEDDRRVPSGIPARERLACFPVAIDGDYLRKSLLKVRQYIHELIILVRWPTLTWRSVQFERRFGTAAAHLLLLNSMLMWMTERQTATLATVVTGCGLLMLLLCMMRHRSDETAFARNTARIGQWSPCTGHETIGIAVVVVAVGPTNKGLTPVEFR